MASKTSPRAGLAGNHGVPDAMWLQQAAGGKSQICHYENSSMLATAVPSVVFLLTFSTVV